MFALALEVDNLNIAIKLRLGDLHQRLGEPAKAAEAFKLAWRQQPEDLQVLRQCLISYLQSNTDGENARAFELFAKSSLARTQLVDPPIRAVLWYELGRCQQQARRQRQPKAYLRGFEEVIHTPLDAVAALGDLTVEMRQQQLLETGMDLLHGVAQRMNAQGAPAMALEAACRYVRWVKSGPSDEPEQASLDEQLHALLPDLTASATCDLLATLAASLFMTGRVAAAQECKALLRGSLDDLHEAGKWYNEMIQGANMARAPDIVQELWKEAFELLGLGVAVGGDMWAAAEFVNDEQAAERLACASKAPLALWEASCIACFVAKDYAHAGYCLACYAAHPAGSLQQAIQLLQEWQGSSPGVVSIAALHPLFLWQMMTHAVTTTPKQMMSVLLHSCTGLARAAIQASQAPADLVLQAVHIQRGMTSLLSSERAPGSPGTEGAARSRSGSSASSCCSNGAQRATGSQPAAAAAAAAAAAPVSGAAHGTEENWFAAAMAADEAAAVASASDEDEPATGLAAAGDAEAQAEAGATVSAPETAARPLSAAQQGVQRAIATVFGDATVLQAPAPVSANVRSQRWRTGRLLTLFCASIPRPAVGTDVQPLWASFLVATTIAMQCTAIAALLPEDLVDQLAQHLPSATLFLSATAESYRLLAKFWQDTCTAQYAERGVSTRLLIAARRSMSLMQWRRPVRTILRFWATSLAQVLPTALHHSAFEDLDRLMSKRVDLLKKAKPPKAAVAAAAAAARRARAQQKRETKQLTTGSDVDEESLSESDESDYAAMSATVRQEALVSLTTEWQQALVNEGQFLPLVLQLRTQLRAAPMLALLPVFMNLLYRTVRLLLMPPMAGVWQHDGDVVAAARAAGLPLPKLLPLSGRTSIEWALNSSLARTIREAGPCAPIAAFISTMTSKHVAWPAVSMKQAIQFWHVDAAAVAGALSQTRQAAASAGSKRARPAASTADALAREVDKLHLIRSHEWESLDMSELPEVSQAATQWLQADAGPGYTADDVLAWSISEPGPADAFGAAAATQQVASLDDPALALAFACLAHETVPSRVNLQPLGFASQAAASMDSYRVARMREVAALRAAHAALAVPEINPLGLKLTPAAQGSIGEISLPDVVQPGMATPATLLHTEVLYNVARMLHKQALYVAALDMYEQALELLDAHLQEAFVSLTADQGSPCVVESSAQCMFGDQTPGRRAWSDAQMRGVAALDLRRDIVWNMVHIYRQVGSEALHGLATQLAEEHLVLEATWFEVDEHEAQPCTSGECMAALHATLSAHAGYASTDGGNAADELLRARLAAQRMPVRRAQPRRAQRRGRKRRAASKHRTPGTVARQPLAATYTGPALPSSASSECSSGSSCRSIAPDEVLPTTAATAPAGLDAGTSDDELIL